MEEMCGAYLSEEQGATATVLPIRQDLRYAIPFKDPGETPRMCSGSTYLRPVTKRLVMCLTTERNLVCGPEPINTFMTKGGLKNFLTVLESKIRIGL